MISSSFLKAHEGTPATTLSFDSPPVVSQNVSRISTQRLGAEHRTRSADGDPLPCDCDLGMRQFVEDAALLRQCIERVRLPVQDIGERSGSAWRSTSFVVDGSLIRSVVKDRL
jgi:hypothetical protein